MAGTAKDESSYSEPAFVTSKNDHKQQFYRPDISNKLVPATKSLLENYSHIPLDAQVNHVHDIREKAWNIRAYPCIGLGVYLIPQLSRLPIYPELLKRLSDGQLLIDLGCFIGHDMRHLVNDGAPSENMYGIDIVNFWDLGYEMYNDRGRFNAHFRQADILSSDSEGAMAEFRHKSDIISIFQVLHQWNWKGQVDACKTLVNLSKPNSLIVGNQMGNTTAQEIVLQSIPIPLWRHDEASFARLWEEVGLATGTEWKCESWLRTFEEMGWKAEDTTWMEEGIRVLEFVVRRVR